MAASALSCRRTSTSLIAHIGGEALGRFHGSLGVRLFPTHRIRSSASSNTRSGARRGLRLVPSGATQRVVDLDPIHECLPPLVAGRVLASWLLRCGADGSTVERKRQVLRAVGSGREAVDGGERELTRYASHADVSRLGADAAAQSDETYTRSMSSAATTNADHNGRWTGDEAGHKQSREEMMTGAVEDERRTRQARMPSMARKAVQIGHDCSIAAPNGRAFSTIPARTDDVRKRIREEPTGTREDPEGWIGPHRSPPANSTFPAEVTRTVGIPPSSASASTRSESPARTFASTSPRQLV